MWDREAWYGAVHGVAKRWNTTERLNSLLIKKVPLSQLALVKPMVGKGSTVTNKVTLPQLSTGLSLPSRDAFSPVRGTDGNGQVTLKGLKLPRAPPLPSPWGVLRSLTTGDLPSALPRCRGVFLPMWLGSPQVQSLGVLCSPL